MICDIKEGSSKLLKWNEWIAMRCIHKKAKMDHLVSGAVIEENALQIMKECDR
jgi:hypothetical protein